MRRRAAWVDLGAGEGGNILGCAMIHLHFSHGRAGLGVVLTSGWGDSTYTVMADTYLDEHGFTIIRAIRIQFTDMGESS